MNISKIPSKFKQETGEMILHFADLQHVMLINIVTRAFVAKTLMPLAKYFPKTIKGFESFEDVIKNEQVLQAVIGGVFSRDKDKFYEILADFNNDAKNKYLIGDIKRAQNFRNILAHAKCVYKPGYNFLAVALGTRKDGSIRSKKIYLKDIIEHKILAKRLVEEIRSESEVIHQREAIIEYLNMK